MKIICVVGARPNFVKIAPIIEEMKKHPDIETILVHTGQHYDYEMSKLFFEDLGIPVPDIHLGISSGSHAEQTADIMKRFELVLLKEKPDYVLVVGDVNSTIACSLTASKLRIKIIHIEAGLRSFDRSMPEEINRVLTDALSDILFTTERSAEENLLREGIAKEKIFFVGNVMIDTLIKQREKAQKSDILFRLGLIASKLKTQNSKLAPYALLTLHRPSNVDHNKRLSNIFEALSVIAKELAIIFPIHPRTRKNIVEFGIDKKFSAYEPNHSIGKGISLIEPLGYLDFLNLMVNAKLVLTDSGGVQEETTVLGIPCITLRENTERPITVTKGTNRVVGTNKERIIVESLKALNKNNRTSHVPELWDGKASTRIVDVILKSCHKEQWM